jgi:hypothetical protein
MTRKRLLLRSDEKVLPFRPLRRGPHIQAWRQFARLAPGATELLEFKREHLR